MKNLAAQVSGVAMLALAALPIVALPAQALAATTVRIADINVLSPEGMAKFHDRADRAARSYCADVRDLGAAASCRRGVKAELNEKVDVIRAARMEQATSTLAAR